MTRLMNDELYGVAEAEQKKRRHRHEQERIDVQVVIGKEGLVGSENDQGIVKDIHDIEHSRHEREPDGDAV